jgi:TPR repeat protein
MKAESNKLKAHKRLAIFAFIFASLSCMEIHAQVFSAEYSKALSGDADAMIKVAEAYEFGKGVAVNDDSSRVWIEKAARLGHPAGMFMFGNLLVTKIYSVTAFAEGMKWLTKAADTNQVQAMLKLFELHSQKGTNTEKDKFYNLSKAVNWLRKADTLGEKKATITLGECYYTGKAVRKNDSIAATYFLRSANDHNLPRAQVRMGDLYIAGSLTGKPEPFDAYNWFKRGYENKTANLDDRSLADVGMHKADQMIKQTQNLMMQSTPFLPPGAFQYRLQKSE